MRHAHRAEGAAVDELARAPHLKPTTAKHNLSDNGLYWKCTVDGCLETQSVQLNGFTVTLNPQVIQFGDDEDM